MALVGPLWAALASSYSAISETWQSIINLDRSTIVNVGLFFAASSTLFHYAQSFLYSIAQKTCLSSVRINDDGLLFPYVMRWVTETQLTGAHRSVEASVPFVNSWQDEAEAAATLLKDQQQTKKGKLVSYRAMIDTRPIRYKPFAGRHLFWYRGRPIVLSHHEWRGVERNQNSRPAYFITLETFGRSLSIIQSLLQEAQAYSLAKSASNTTVYRAEIGKQGLPSTWSKVASRAPREIGTVIFDEERKQTLLHDMNDYLHPTTRQWYLDHGIPYRRGYLFSGAPGTGKTSLTTAVAGSFGLDIYIISLLDSELTETQLTRLFAALPSRCILLLEDIDAAGLVRDETKRNISCNISLSALLNAIDGVSSPEGRILIMTTNRFEVLDPALVRPGRVDMHIVFTLPARTDIENLFLSIYKSPQTTRLIAADRGKAPTEDSNNPTRFSNRHRSIGETQVPEKEPSRLEIVDPKLDLEALARQFATQLPERKFSIAAIQGYLLQHKQDPLCAVENAAAWAADGNERLLVLAEG